MKRSRFTETQIVSILKESERGISVVDLCRKHGMSDATFYKWRAKYGGLEASDLKRLKAIEEENLRLKRMYSELSLDHQILKDVLEKKL